MRKIKDKKKKELKKNWRRLEKKKNSSRARF